MKHEWSLQGVKKGTASLIPIASYKCDICGKIEHIYLDATKALVEILSLNDCTKPMVDNSPGAILNRASDKLYSKTMISGDLRYILDCLITSGMMVNERVKLLRIKVFEDD
jgi:hypothetical protein